MKPFNLKEAQEGASVITRLKRKVRIICYDRKTKGKAVGPIVALVLGPQKSFETLVTYDINGKQSNGIKDLDLFLED